MDKKDGMDGLRKIRENIKKKRKDFYACDART